MERFFHSTQVLLSSTKRWAWLS
jgi:TRAP-type uncharacterized transport system, periplasmic component